ncbi:MAG: glycosyltransferase, partial [Chloroflexi bacterium]|nr:glycosyltransferase [Chloroflexota bacterium]
IGDGVDRPHLEAEFAETDTFFTGYLFGEELSQAFASADVFLFPGMAETFGQVVQEAMASGLPCVVANKGGAADLIEDGTSGYLVEPTAAAFASAVQQLRDDRDHCLQLGQAARRQAEQAPWEKILSELEAHYEHAVRLNQRAQRLR